MTDQIRIRGYRELNRAFGRADRELKNELKRALYAVGKPVAEEAKKLARERFRNIRKGRKDWSTMRVGVTSTVTYVAPRQRATKDPSRKRKKFGSMLMARAMEPALDHEREHVVREFEHLIDTVGRAWERG